MSNCRYIKKLIQKYVENDAAHPKTAQIIDHIKECESCRTEYLAYTDIINGCRRLSEVELPSAFRQDLHCKLVGIAEESQNRNRRFALRLDNKFLNVASCIAVIMIIFIAFVGINPADWYALLESGAYDAELKYIGTDDRATGYEEANESDNELYTVTGNINAEMDRSIAGDSAKSRNMIETDDVAIMAQKDEIMPIDNAYDSTAQIMMFSLPTDVVCLTSKNDEVFIDLKVDKADFVDCLENIRNIVYKAGGTINQVDKSEMQRSSGQEYKQNDFTGGDRTAQTVIAEIAGSQYDIFIEEMLELFPNCVINNQYVGETIDSELADDVTVVHINIVQGN